MTHGQTQPFIVKDNNNQYVICNRSPAPAASSGPPCPRSGVSKAKENTKKGENRRYVRNLRMPLIFFVPFHYLANKSTQTTQGGRLVVLVLLATAMKTNC